MNRFRIFCVGALLLAGTLFAGAVSAQEDAPAAEERAPETPEAASLDEIRRFVAVFRAVQQGYVDPIDDAQLMRAAIRGLLLDLDPHSAYLDEERSRALSETASGAYEGIGIEVLQQPDRSLLVISPIDGSPAAAAGILPGDVIVQIDGEPIEADSVDEASESMRGPAGTEVRLDIRRGEQEEPLELVVKRGKIRVSSIRLETLEPGYVYARITQFQSDTGLELGRSLKERQQSGPLQGLVLDLRRNPGGLLHAAIEAADLFLDGGVIVSTKGRTAQSNSQSVAHQGDVLDGAPIAILVDGGTASAAEVMAGALRDHQRAIVLGQPTFGKGSVQTVLPLDNGDSLKLTTARYYTPSGTSIQAEGIQPDIRLDHRSSWYYDRPATVRERDLPGHLRGVHEDDDDREVVETGLPEELEDPDVREALNLIRGVNLFNQRGAAEKP